MSLPQTDVKKDTVVTKHPPSQRSSAAEGESLSVASDTEFDDDLSEYDVDPSPLSSPDRGISRGRLATQFSGKVKRLKIELPPSVIRGFLDDGKGSLKELRDVNSLREITERAEAVVRVCKAPPVQAFYYCMDYADGTPEGFLDLRRRANLAFHLEGMRIMHMLSEEDREKLVDTPLADVLTEFRNRDARLMVLSALKQSVDDETAMEMLNDAACQGRLSIGGEETALARKLLEFWKERHQADNRKERLRLAFAGYGMQLRENCAFCNAYINGKVDADIDDVIGVSVVASRLRGRRKDITQYLPACEEELRKHIHHRTTELETAVHLAMLATRPVERMPESERPTTASLLAHCTRPSNYLPFSVMVLRKEIIASES